MRPLTQITGEAEFNEIFFRGVGVPVENVLGEIGGGWRVAMTTLLHERGTLGFSLIAQIEVPVRKLLTLAPTGARPPPSATPSPASGSSRRRFAAPRTGR